MKELNDQEFDGLLRAHFSRELDGRLGNAAGAFASSHRFDRLSAVARWSAAGLAAAAAMVFSIYVSMDWMRPPGATVIPAHGDPGSGRSPSVDLVSAPVPLGRSVTWRSFDEGMVHMPDNTPARRVRRQSVQQVQWYDPSGQRVIRATIPLEEIEYLKIERY